MENEVNTENLSITISKAIQDYLENLAISRSQNTARTYRNALKLFTQVLREYHLSPVETRQRTGVRQPVLRTFT